MKTIVLANQKGGVGKSAIAVQLAYFFYHLLKKRVLVIDLDHQHNTSKAIITGKSAHQSAYFSSQLLSSSVANMEDHPFVLIAADSKELLRMEKQPDKHNIFVNNLNRFIKETQAQFDVCIIDTNPNPDIRQLSALIVSDYVLCPLQLNQEAIDGIGVLLNHENIGIRKIQATLNPTLHFIGVLPNMVEPTPFQRENFKDLITHFSKLLIPLASGFAAIKKTTAIAEAQAVGLPVWKLGKTSARDAWVQIKPVFEKIASVMEIN